MLVHPRAGPLQEAPDRVSGAGSTVDVARAQGSHALRISRVAGNGLRGASVVTAVVSAIDGIETDGIETDGRINPDSGAESTIHALMTMLTPDANPALKAKALGIDETVSTVGLSVVEAEAGTITGSGTVVMPSSSWTGR